MLAEKAPTPKPWMGLQIEAVNALGEGVERAIPHVERSKIADHAR
jgi:hypothetical protein